MLEGQDLVVTKHNNLIEASYKLTLNEQRLILSCVAQIDSRKSLPKNNLFTLTAKEFSDLYGIDESNAYKALDEAASTLYERDIRTYDGRCRERFRWVCGIKYHDQEGKVTLGFSSWIIPYLTQLHKHFSSYPLKQISGLKSVYAIRLFEFLMQFKNTEKHIVSVEKFKERLGLQDDYKRFYDLKKWVIAPAIKELKEKSGLNVSFKTIKGRTGRAIQQLEFSFREIKSP